MVLMFWWNKIRHQRLVLRHPLPRAFSDTSTDIQHEPQGKGERSWRLKCTRNAPEYMCFHFPSFISILVLIWGCLEVRWAPPAVIRSGRALVTVATALCDSLTSNQSPERELSKRKRGRESPAFFLCLLSVVSWHYTGTVVVSDALVDLVFCRRDITCDNQVWNELKLFNES